MKFKQNQMKPRMAEIEVTFRVWKETETRYYFFFLL